MPSLKPDCPYAFREKTQDSTVFDAEQSVLWKSGLPVNDREIRGIIRVFWRRASGNSLQLRLHGGACSLALTFLRENSLLTGKITGNL